jgi:hypothetical protein
MPKRARLYINSTIVVGLTLLAGCLLFEREFRDPARYFGYLALACLGSTLKIKLPKIRGTMSINFLFILIGVAELTIAETITLGCVAALIQCLWKARKQPALIQVLFNIATVVTSVAIAFSASHALVNGENLPVLLAVAVCVYFVANTGMVSLVLSLTEQQLFTKVWRQCYLWSFPYYLVGAAIACAITISSRTLGWKPSLLMLPLMYLVYSYYRLYLSYQTDNDYKSV